jgi:hypothetical protein
MRPALACAGLSPATVRLWIAREGRGELSSRADLELGGDVARGGLGVNRPEHDDVFGVEGEVRSCLGLDKPSKLHD